MDYPVLTKTDLAKFSGRPEASYKGDYPETALSQALLLFKLGTCLAGLPDDPTKAELARMGILAMADDIFLKQKYQQVSASPFSSESIGSYSYSKRAQQASQGEETGVMWFDLAVGQLGECERNDGISSGGGIEVFEHDATFVQGAGENVRMLSPKDLDLSRQFGFDPSRGGF